MTVSALFAAMVGTLAAKGAVVDRQIQMRLQRSRRFLLACAFCMVALPQAASAVVIGFDGLPDSTFSGPHAEDGFIYDLLPNSGGLEVVDIAGYPPPHMEGSTALGGGTLRIRRIGGGLFTFVAADVSNWQSYGNPADPREIDFVGLLAGVKLQTDVLLTVGGDGDDWVTRVSDALRDVLIDELWVVLDAKLIQPPPGQTQEWAEVVDNIVLLDAPTPLALVGLGLVLVGYQRRGRAA